MQIDETDCNFKFSYYQGRIIPDSLMFEPEDIPLKKTFIDVLNSALTLGNNAEAARFQVLTKRMRTDNLKAFLLFKVS